MLVSTNQLAAGGTTTTTGSAADLSGRTLTSFAGGDIIDVTDLDPRQSSVTAVYDVGTGTFAIGQDGAVKVTMTLAAGLAGRFTVTTDLYGRQLALSGTGAITFAAGTASTLVTGATALQAASMTV